MYTANEIQFRKQLARLLLTTGESDLESVAESPDIVPDEIQNALAEPPVALAPVIAAAAAAAPALNIPFPAEHHPKPKPIVPPPAPSTPLPKVDVVVVTWTIPERNAMADVLTPGASRWYSYNRRYDEFYDERIRNGAPSKLKRILGSYFVTEIGTKKVLCFKSELHLNQDGVEAAPHGSEGNATLPVMDMFLQIMVETEATHILTVGTCGGIILEHDLGDVLVTRAARFRCQDEFRNAPFNSTTYSSDWTIPTTHFKKAEELMSAFADNLLEPKFGPPTKRHNGTWTLNRPYQPSIIHEGGDGANNLPPLHPILTTDFFEFGTSGNANDLSTIGCGLEMGDAALGLAVSTMNGGAPKWAVIRNISDPQINGDLTRSPRALDMQSHWAVWYYEAFGYWTSVMSALTTWAVIAGL